MTGLIYKDFLALKGHLTTYLVFFLVYGGLCLSGVFTASVLCGMWCSCPDHPYDHRHLRRREPLEPLRHRHPGLPPGGW